MREEDEKALSTQLKAMRDKARRSLKSARTLFKAGDYESSSSRAYYAVFHMMQAVLLTKGLSYSGHSAVINAFSHHFIKKALFPSDFGKAIRRLRKAREMGDYNYFATISREEARRDIEAASNMVRSMEQYLMEFMKGVVKIGHPL